VASGTSGAVISVYDDAVLVEIIGPGGETRDTISTPAERVRISNA
jgi:hypothetical protein